MAFSPTNPAGWNPGDPITADQMNDLDGKTVDAIDGAAGGTYAAPLNFTNLVGLIVNGEATFNQNVTPDTANFSVTSGSGIGIQGGAFLTLANTATLSMQSGAIQNVQSGATVNIASGGAISVSGTETVNSGGSIVIASGGNLNVAAGGNLTVSGTETIASGGTLVFASGSTASYAFGSSAVFSGLTNFGASSVVSFASSPTFTNGFLVSAGPAQFNAAVNCLGATNLLSTANFSGTTTIVGASNRLKITPRSEPRRISLSNAFVVAFANYDATNDRIQLSAGGIVALDLVPPDNSTLADVQVTWTGTGNVTITVLKNATTLDTTTVTVAGTYTLSPNEVVDNEANTYRLTFAENAGNAPTITVVKTFCTVSEYDPG